MMTLRQQAPDGTGDLPEITIASARSDTAVFLSLQMAGILSVKIFLIRYTFEMFVAHDLYEAQHFLIGLLDCTLSVWAMVEIALVYRKRSPLPLKGLSIAMGAQLAVGVIRCLSDWTMIIPHHLVDFGRNRFDFGLATILIPLYAILFLIVSKLLINAFSFTERLRADQLEQANQKLAEISLTDGLTGISNRHHFDMVLAKELARHARSGDELSLVLLDIDHFKAFNDSYGHVKGDECLRRVGQVLRECAVRPADLAARYGGEEFACILPETDYRGAVKLAENIRSGIQALAIPHRASPVAECVTASLGVLSMRCAAGDRADDILTRVDALLYRAKSSGRNRVESGAEAP